ncbi:MAG: hypothetical protein KAJ55_10080 [Anaerolineales bacterium]|nr:hypothetical protein [Anaerolineales bacterium]
MPLNFENIMNAMGLINAAIPSVAKVIVKLKNGKEIDLTELTEQTRKIVDDKLAEAAEHLAKPGE